MTIFSAHDTTVFSLLAALDETDGRPSPYFTSHVILELWQPREESAAPSDLLVRASYDGKLLPLSSFGCRDDICSLERFADQARQEHRAVHSCLQASQ
jgi:hypothetical protein